MKTICIILATFISANVFCQSLNDYRTKNSTGYWHNASSWERYNGTTWVDATESPNYSNANIITVRLYHEIIISTDIHVDQMHVLGNIVIDTGGELNVRNGSGPDLVFNWVGALINSGTVDRYSGAEIQFNDYSVYSHARNGGSIPVALWGAGSYCEINGVSDNMPSGLTQNFGNFYWNCTTQTNDLTMAGNFGNAKGDFEVIHTNGRFLRFAVSATSIDTVFGNFRLHANAKFQMSSGVTTNRLVVMGNFLAETNSTFYIAESNSGTNTMEVYGNFTLKGQQFWLSNGASSVILRIRGNFDMQAGRFEYVTNSPNCNVYFDGTSPQYFTKTGGIIYNQINFIVSSGATLDLGTYVLGDYLYTSGTFTLQSGATLRTMHSQGITSSGNTGCIQNNGSRNYHQYGHYVFYSNGSQASGNGLPSNIYGSVTIGSTANTTNLSFSNSTTFFGKLNMVKGTVATSNIGYASTGILEYMGNTAQTMGNNEWPSSTVPNLRINNISGVTMNASKSITSNLNLFTGNLSIGANNTLTLHNATITVNSGTLTGGNLSNIVFSGSGNATLPAVENGLKDLTINRAGATITIGGAVIIYGTLTMSNGTCALGSGSISYGESATLKYNNQNSNQTTSSAEFPTTNGPPNLVIENPNQVNLHANRQIDQMLTLTSGNLSIGTNTLTINGYVQASYGQLTSAINGHLLYAENINPTFLAPSTGGIYKVTINRSGGVVMNANTTITDELVLANGNLSIGNRQLTLNGLITQGNGMLTGGGSASIVFGGSGLATTLPGITLKTLTINRPNGIILGGNVLITDELILTLGVLDIKNNILTINNWISTTDGSLGSQNSTVIVNESSGLMALPFPPANIGTLRVWRSMGGVILNGDITINTELDIQAGNFSIANRTLTLNGLLTLGNGNLVSNSSSSLVVGGTAPTLSLPLSQLGNLTIQRPDGIELQHSLTIYGVLTMITGPIELNGQSIKYHTTAVLKYMGLQTQTTSDAEWPVNNGPWSVDIQNLNGVYLHANRTIGSLLRITAGNFYIQDNTLTLNGDLQPLFGQLVGSNVSNLHISGLPMISPLNLPNIILNDLTLNRSSGLYLVGALDLYGVLKLVNGIFNISNQMLTLRKPVAGNPDNLISGPMSKLSLAGSEPGLDIGPDRTIRITQLSELLINNTHETGVHLSGLLDISNLLIINHAARFILDPGSKLTVSGNIHNPGGPSNFILRSAFNARKERNQPDPSVIYFGDVQAKVERWMNGQDMWWHQLSSPVGMQNIDDPLPSNFDEGAVFVWNEPHQTWVSYQNNTVTPTWLETNQGLNSFIPNKGYMVAYEGNPIKEFKGQLNRGPYFQVLDVKCHESEPYRGFNLAGNPYPSSIDWKSPVGWLRGDLVDDGSGGYTMWIWNPEVGNYGSFNSNGEEGTNGVSRYIPPMQGFWVQAAVDDGALGITDFTRVHSNQPWLKNTAATTPSLKIRVSGANQSYSDEVLIESGPNTGGSPKMFSLLPQAPSLYLLKDGRKWSIVLTNSINSLAPVELCFMAGIPGYYTIEFNFVANDEKMWLEDRFTGQVQTVGPGATYAFYAEQGQEANRFVLHTAVPGSRPPLDGIFYLTSENGFIIIRFPFSENTVIGLYELSGRLVQEVVAAQPGEVRIKTPSSFGVYLLRIANSQGTAVRKILAVRKGT